MRKVISKDGTSIAYEKIGNGPPLILVDGAMCSTKMGPMSTLAPMLAKDFTVIYYDRRGRNESGDTKPYAVAREVEDIDALIGIAGGSSYVFGMSSGAALTIAAAAAGLKITRLAVYEPPFMIDKGDHQIPADYQQKVKAYADADQRGKGIKYFMTAGIGLPAIAVFMMQLMPAWKKMKSVAHTLPYDAAIMGDFLLPANISNIKVPTLVAGGEKSQSWLRRAVQELTRALPDGEFQMLKGQTHQVSEKVLAPVLIDFFKR